MADTMQNEAMERLKQMYSKPQTQTQTRDETSQKPKSPKSDENEQEKSQQSTNEQPKHKSENLLDIFMRDKEKSLIVLLIVLLLNEKADSTLILALMYLII